MFSGFFLVSASSLLLAVSLLQGQTLARGVQLTRVKVAPSVLTRSQSFVPLSFALRLTASPLFTSLISVPVFGHSNGLPAFNMTKGRHQIEAERLTQ
jgi:hypothetical protein